MASSQRSSDGNSTADRTLSILQMFRLGAARVTAVEVAEHLGVTRSTAYRYLQPLLAAGFLEDGGSEGGFQLGPAVLELARTARRAHGLTDLGRPLMRRLAHELGQTVLLTRRLGTGIVCLEREEYEGQYVRFSYDRGTQLGLTAGASALILLAWEDEDRVRNLFRQHPAQSYTSATLVEEEALMARLRVIRGAGHAVSRGEVDSGAMGVAAPVRDAVGQVSAGLSAVFLQAHCPEDYLAYVIAKVTAAAEELSLALARYSD